MFYQQSYKKKSARVAMFLAMLGFCAVMIFCLPITGVATPKNLEKATLAAGCFWGTEEFFRKIPGVEETVVGYTGGSEIASYEQVSTGKTGHAEAVEIQFDPKVVSFRALLVQFFKMHDPTTLNQQGNDRGTQYRSAIFTHSERQHKIASELMQQIESSHAWKKPLTTQITPAKTFYKAEEYHQKYLIKNPHGYDNHFLRDLNFN